MPLAVTTTISPGFRSRTKRAPMMSSAQVSEARIQEPSRSPSTSGRMPSGSRHADHLLRGQRHQREGAFDLADRLDEAGVEVALLAGGDQMQDRLGVGGRGEDRALLLQRALHGQALVMLPLWAIGEAAVGKLGEEGLHVAQAGAAGGGVARVADRAGARQPVDHRLLGEGVADQADMALDVELAAVIGDDAGGFLAAMLQRMQPERRRSPPRPAGRRCRTRRIRRGNGRRPRRQAWSALGPPSGGPLVAEPTYRATAALRRATSSVVRARRRLGRRRLGGRASAGGVSARRRLGRRLPAAASSSRRRPAAAASGSSFRDRPAAAPAACRRCSSSNGRDLASAIQAGGLAPTSQSKNSSPTATTRMPRAAP